MCSTQGPQSHDAAHRTQAGLGLHPPAVLQTLPAALSVLSLADTAPAVSCRHRHHPRASQGGLTERGNTPCDGGTGRQGKTRRDDTTAGHVTLAEMYRRDTARWDCLAVRACGRVEARWWHRGGGKGVGPLRLKLWCFFRGRGRSRLHTSLHSSGSQRRSRRSMQVHAGRPQTVGRWRLGSSWPSASMDRHGVVSDLDDVLLCSM